MKTAITEMFGIKYPIICGAMMWLCKPKLCAAISNAGGMGNLTAGNYSTEEEFRDAIKLTRKLTDKPFMVNVTILPSVHITPEHHKMFLRVCVEERVAGLEISGTPLDKVVGREYVDVMKKAGIKLFHKVGAVRHAVHAEKVGYDGIYAAGIEEGGHPLNDDVTTMILTPRIAETVKIPVVTVGGIADGRTLAAALALGAQGVMMATRFVATQECEVHDNIKRELVRRQEYETALICKTIGLQGRAIKNKLVEEVLAVEEKGGGLEKLIPLIAGEKIKEAWEYGKVDTAPMMMGQSVGLVKDIPTCKDLIEGIVAKAKTDIEYVTNMFKE
ncbi:MAG: nitronate monooxygenase [Deltaproteobacteria bacterium HGW-Deltaproteobacteria-2]|jgi:nitronate monooxygenase|nr:MAG: nitronate monooxygenase [Deltaproteobacteria bacterium HGW-Deltaproteobacteria-2]